METHKIRLGVIVAILVIAASWPGRISAYDQNETHPVLARAMAQFYNSGSRTKLSSGDMTATSRSERRPCRKIAPAKWYDLDHL